MLGAYILTTLLITGMSTRVINVAQRRSDNRTSQTGSILMDTFEIVSPSSELVTRVAWEYETYQLCVSYLTITTICLQ